MDGGTENAGPENAVSKMKDQQMQLRSTFSGTPAKDQRPKTEDCARLAADG